MCRALFIGTGQAISAAVLQLPSELTVEREWSHEKQFYPLLRRVLAHPYVYRIVTPEGCGCGFESTGLGPGADLRRGNMAALAASVEKVVTDAGPVELYTDWDFENMPERHEIFPEDFQF